jgi:hypothetical protein
MEKRGFPYLIPKDLGMCGNRLLYEPTGKKSEGIGFTTTVN